MPLGIINHTASKTLFTWQWGGIHWQSLTLTGWKASSHVFCSLLISQSLSCFFPCGIYRQVTWIEYKRNYTKEEIKQSKNYTPWQKFQCSVHQSQCLTYYMSSLEQQQWNILTIPLAKTITEMFVFLHCYKYSNFHAH